MIRRLLLGMFVLFSSMTNVANAALELVITDGIDSARPIAVVPFKWEGTQALPTDISAVIASDLQRSGKFSPVPTSKMPQTPFSESEVNFDAWTNLGVDALLTGSIKQNAQGDYVINYQLVDIVRGQLTGGKSKALGSDGEL
ncbi:Tol-Pal system beta propeller repeat protein TolB, partial [Vibrio diabolicus]